MEEWLEVREWEVGRKNEAQGGLRRGRTDKREPPGARLGQTEETGLSPRYGLRCLEGDLQGMGKLGGGFWGKVVSKRQGGPGVG